MAKSKTWNDTILAEHRSFLREDSAREAFDVLVAAAIALPGYDFEPVWRKPKRSFNYHHTESGERPFALIVNRRHLLFHLRAAGLKSVSGGFAELKRRFSAAAKNPRGEWTVRIASKSDAERLNKFLFPAARASVDPQMQEMPHHWWANHGKSLRQEIDGGYLWLRRKNKNSAQAESEGNITRAMPGDVVFAFAEAAIRAVGVVLARAQEAPRPAEPEIVGDQPDDTPGWQVPVRFRELKTPLHPKDHAAALAAVLPKRHSPIQANGDDNEALYLAAVPEPMAAVLRRLLGSQLDSAERRIKDSVGPEFSDDIAEARLQHRADLGWLKKETLIRARRGHGQYRQELEKVETGCRLTGLIDRRHLRASHIKPWCVANDDEKLDPNNGLLLSPHAEHLFDRGYISFTDQGELLVSQFLNPVVLSDWGLKVPIKPKPFNARQCAYLAYHRDHVFENHGRGKQPDERDKGDAARPGGDIVLREIVRGPEA
jgi:putative restriction endonuclease